MKVSVEKADRQHHKVAAAQGASVEGHREFEDKREVAKYHSGLRLLVAAGLRGGDQGKIINMIQSGPSDSGQRGTRLKEATAAERLDGRSRPGAGNMGQPVSQRKVDTEHARTNNEYFAKAEDVILGAIAQADGELWRMINDESAKVDLVIKSELGTFDGLGETSPMAFYNEERRGRIEDLMHEGIDLQGERITIELQVVPPVLHFWERSPGQAAATIAHEYAIHAERYTNVIKHIREVGNRGEGVEYLNYLGDLGEFDPDVHHLSVFEDDEYHDRYARLVGIMATLFRETGMEKEAANIEKGFQEDIKEHKTQARFGKSPEKIKEQRRIVRSRRFQMLMMRNAEQIQQARDVLERLPRLDVQLPVIQTIEDCIENK